MKRVFQPQSATALKIGTAVLIAVASVVYLNIRKGGFAERPGGSGDVGFLFVFGQLPEGPLQLQPGRTSRLLRPQHMAFQFECSGTGPRFVRIELEAEGERSVMFEEKIETPMRRDSLGYVLELGDEAPDNLLLITTIEAPHATNVESRFPLKLMGKSHPFWEQVVP